MKNAMYCILFVISSSVICSQNTIADTLTFGVVPQQSAKKLAANWSPILQYLSQQTGHTIQFATAKNIPTFEKRLAQGQYDVAYMNPYHFTVFNQQPGYQALVRQKSKKIRGIIVVHADSDITSLEQLAGSELAFPAPAAFAATIIPRANMQQRGVAIDPKYVSSHDSVYLNVAKKFFVAGGGVVRTFNNTPEQVRDNLRIIWQSEPYTSHAIATNNQLSAEVVQMLKAGLLAMNNDDAALALLNKIAFSGFEPAHNKDWDDVRALNIDSLTRTAK